MHVCPLQLDIVISTHTSLAGRDFEGLQGGTVVPKFLLTRPSRDVTTTENKRNIQRNISTHTSLAGRDIQASLAPVFLDFISTHTSLAGRDDDGKPERKGKYAFLLTRPSRDVTATSCINKQSRTAYLGTDNFYIHIISI